MLRGRSILSPLPRRAGAIVTGSLVAGWLACAPRLPALPASALTPAVSLEFLAEFIIPTGARFPDLDRRADAFGSLSGIARDEATGLYLAVNDDRIDTRVIWLDIRLAGGALTVTPTRIAPLAAGPGVEPRRATAADLEAVTALPDGTFVAAEEGHVVADGRLPYTGIWPPALLAIDRDARVTGITDFPAMFGVGDRGIRENQGFESVTRLPDGRLVAGLEQPRFEDGDTPGHDRGARTRLVEFTAAGARWQPRRQWIYELAPTPRLDGFDRLCSDGENGLSDLLALDAARLLSIERSCLLNQAGTARNAIRIFEVDVSAADDVAGLGSLAGATARPSRKSLVLDLETLIPRLSPALAGLENFEGLAFGPPLPGGGRTLLVVSDNNDRATQKTAFLLFAITDGPQRH